MYILLGILACLPTPTLLKSHSFPARARGFSNRCCQTSRSQDGVTEPWIHVPQIQTFAVSQMGALLRKQIQPPPPDPSEIIRDPTYPDPTASMSSQRVCQSSYEGTSGEPRDLRWPGLMSRVFEEVN